MDNGSEPRGEDELNTLALATYEAKERYKLAADAFDKAFAPIRQLTDAHTQALHKMVARGARLSELKPIVVFGNRSPEVEAALRSALAESKAAEAEAIELEMQLVASNEIHQPLFDAMQVAFRDFMTADAKFLAAMKARAEGGPPAEEK